MPVHFVERDYCTSKVDHELLFGPGPRSLLHCARDASL